MIFLVVGISILVTILIVFGIGRALGPSTKPKPRQIRFDETPADVTALDTSNGVPLDLKYDPLAPDWDINIPSKATPEEQARLAETLERFTEQMRADQKR